jgi:predicted DNA binding CopG/RHH family protein
MKKKDRNIMFRISEEDYQTLTKKAKAEMLSNSAYIRRKCILNFD